MGFGKGGKGGEWNGGARKEDSLVEVDAAVGEFAEGSLLLELCAFKGTFFSALAFYFFPFFISFFLGPCALMVMNDITFVVLLTLLDWM